jgi:DNA-nicking Smr family endonuclease
VVKSKGSNATPKKAKKASAHPALEELARRRDERQSEAQRAALEQAKALERANARKAQASQTAQASAKVPRLPEGPLDDTQLFQSAVGELQDFDVHELKYSTADEAPRRRTPKSQREREAEDEKRLFAQMMSGTTPVNKGQERVLQRAVPPAAPRPQAAPAPMPEDHEAELATLSRGQRQLLERARRQLSRDGTLPSLMLRGATREQALDRMLAFLSVSDGAPETGLARIITGKGLRSNDDPVLKPMAHRELERHPRVAEFAPEIGADGDFGAYIVRLKRRARDRDDER